MEIFGFLIDIDHGILTAINSFAGDHVGLDRMVRLISDNYLLKGIVTGLLFWGLWFAPGPAQPKRREQLSAMLLIACTAIFVGRLLALMLPFRPRPMHTPGLNYDLPIGMSPTALSEWSSFPSDHAVLYAAIAAGFFMINRTVGIVAFIHAILVIMLPRAFLGLHFPSDLLAGTIIGIGMSVLLMRPVTAVISRLGILEIERRWPQVFYPAVFLVTFQVASMFDSARQFVTALLNTFAGAA